MYGLNNDSRRYVSMLEFNRAELYMLESLIDDACTNKEDSDLEDMRNKIVEAIITLESIA